MMFNRLGKQRKTGEWGKENDSVSAVDINLYWHVYNQIFHDDQIKFDHYFLIYAKETKKVNEVTGEQDTGYTAVIDSKLTFENFKRIYFVDEIEFNI